MSFSSFASPMTEEKNDPIVGVTFSFPWMNHYRYVNYYKKEQAKTFGFFGLGFSGYYKKNIHKVSLNISLTEDLSSPIAAINFDKKDITTNIGNTYFELIYHRPLIDDVNLIAGMNFTNYVFRVTSMIDSISSYKKIDQTLGFSLGLEYRFNYYYSVAGVYRPAFASFETDGKYRHLINIELRIDLDFKKNQ
ncbi:MAG: outer membrane beta-barrel protein [Bacteroidetes bacterium]|nr:outer membrane beta-barrel protein [Bacteroidota bacterium]